MIVKPTETPPGSGAFYKRSARRAQAFNQRRRIIRTGCKRATLDIQSHFNHPLVDRRRDPGFAKDIDRISVDFLDFRAASLAPVL
jgi:hypothetical protein